MKQMLALLVLFISTILFADEADEPNGQVLNRNEKSYKNTVLGFEFRLPAGWYLPKSEADDDPHFYSCSTFNCDLSFEIQLEPKSSPSQKKKHEDVSFKGRVPGATIFPCETIPPAGESWDEGFRISPEKSKKQFHFLTNDCEGLMKLIKEKRFAILEHK